MELRNVMGEGGEVSFLSDQPALAKVAAVRSIRGAQVRAATPAESKVAGRMPWAAGRAGGRLRPESERRPRRLEG